MTSLPSQPVMVTDSAVKIIAGIGQPVGTGSENSEIVLFLLVKISGYVILRVNFLSRLG